MTAYDLKYRVMATGSCFFDRSSMKFFGDTMANYRVRKHPVEVETYSGDKHKCWVLYRRKPVKHGLWNDTYFDVETFERVLEKK